MSKSVSSSTTFKKSGNKVGAKSFTGSYSMAFSCCSSETKGIVLFNLFKTSKIMLNTRPIFKAPKTPPSNLFKRPKEAKSAILVKTFPIEAIIITMMTNVMAKETIVI